MNLTIKSEFSSYFLIDSQMAILILSFISRLINPNYKRSVICAAIANSGDEEWDFALERYLSTDLSSEKEMLLFALSCSSQPQALNTY